MHSTLKLKCLIITSYSVVLFTYSRLSDVISLFRDGTVPTSKTYLNPEKLSVSTLKQVLDGRGVSYPGMFEKNEFVQRIKDTGNVSAEEVLDAVVSAAQTIKNHSFNTGLHFYEEVKDTKESAWLVQVTSSSLDNSLLPEPIWDDLKTKLATLGVRTGTFNCLTDKKLCKRKKWNSPRLILALPHESRAKEDVIMHDYVMSNTAANVLHWVRKQLSEYVTEIHSNLVLKDWMTYTSKSLLPDIRVVMYSRSKVPCPMFLYSLAINFLGRVSFATVDASKISLPPDIVHLASDFPIYTVVTPEKVLIYGHRRGENYNFKSMEQFLRTFEPVESDMFLGSLLLVNAFAVMELIFKFSPIWTHFALYFLFLMVKYNGALFLFWLFGGIPHLQLFTNLTLACLRYLSGSCLGCLLRSDFKNLYSFEFLLFTFVVFSVVATCFMKKYRWLEESQPLIFENWWRPHSAESQRPETPEQPFYDYSLRLVFPDLQLPSGRSLDYIQNLPVWLYQDESGATDEESLSADKAEGEVSLQKENKSLKGSIDSKDSVTNCSDLLKEQKHNVFKMKQCTICLGIFCSSEFLCGLPCGHVFHVHCAVAWLVDKNKCPVCRHRV